MQLAVVRNFVAVKKFHCVPVAFTPAPAPAAAVAVAAAAAGIVLNLLQKVFIGWLCATATL